MPPIRRKNKKRKNKRRSWLVRRLSQLWHLNPSFWSTVIVWAITSYKSSNSYRKWAQAQRAYNPLCSSSSTCLYIQIPFLAIPSLHILSFYMLYKITTMIIRSIDHVGENISMSAKMLKDWYKWANLMIAVLVFICMEQYDNAVPWVSVLYAVSGASLLVGYFILMMNWWTTIVAKDRDEQPAQELNRCLHKRGSKSGNSDKKPDDL